jgi:type VI secretion system lysozyme-like protein
MDASYPTSFLDRLLPAALGVPTIPARVGLDVFLEILARDLEDLLDTSAAGPALPSWARECSGSILAYGLPDRAFFSGDPAETARLVASTIERFEPRLEQVRVHAIAPDPSRPDQVLLELRARLVGGPGHPVALSARLGPGRAGVGVTLEVPGRDEG